MPSLLSRFGLTAQNGWNWARIICLLAILCFALVFFAAQVRLYQAGTMQIADLAYFVQPLDGMLHGTPWQVSIEHEITGVTTGDRHFFAEHCYLALLTFLPFYALVPHVYTLFLLQAFLPPLGAFLILLIAKDRLKSNLLALCLSLAYLLYIPFQWAVLNGIYYGFHVENLFPPLFLLAHYLLRQRKKRWVAFVAFALSLTVVESYAVMVICYAFYVLILVKEEQRFGLVLLLFSAAYFAVALLVVIPRYRQGGMPYYFSVFQELQGGQAIPAAIRRVAEYAPRYFVYLFVPLLFLPFLEPALLAVMVPSLVINFAALLANYVVPASPRSWHTNPIIPICFLAAIGAISKLGKWKRIGTSGLRWLGILVLVVGMMLSAWKGPLQSVFLSSSSYIQDYRAMALSDVGPLIPGRASLSADLFLGSHFVQREDLHVFPAHWEEAEYVLLDLNTWDAYKSVLEQLNQSSRHELVYNKGSVYLFRRK